MKKWRGWVAGRLRKTVRIRARLFRRATTAVPNIRFSGCGRQRLKPFYIALALAASLKRSPDTNQLRYGAGSLRS